MINQQEPKPKQNLHCYPFRDTARHMTMWRISSGRTTQEGISLGPTQDRLLARERLTREQVNFVVHD